MTVVPVLWVNRNPEGLARGYYDEGFLEAVLARAVWTPPDPIRFEHVDCRGEHWPPVEGALVVVPCRHHVDDADWLLQRLEELDWSVVILAGDEEWAFPWERIVETARRRVWTMQPIPEHAHLSGHLPGGWYPDTDVQLSKHRERADDRPLDWMFAGQVTHVRREACADVLRAMPADRSVLHETDGYLRGMPRETYFELIAGAKVVPGPSGPCTVDTARPLEALEAGAIPVVDTLRPTDPQFDYWSLVFHGDVPFPTIADWADFPDVLAELLDGWVTRSNRVYAWWQGWKRRVARQLDLDLRAVSHLPYELNDVDDLITVVVTTSPTPSHPWTGMIEETVDSVRAQLPRAEILIAVDGVRPEQADRYADYEEYVRRLLWLSNFRWSNVLPLIVPEWRHQANATRWALDEVHTPLILFVEHDTPLVGNIAWETISEAILGGEANVVRFHHETEIFDVHQDLMLDPEPRQVETPAGPVPLRRTAAWWQRPHLASTAFYRNAILPIFSPDARTMIEDVVYGITTSAWIDEGEAGWDDWRLWIYQPPGNMKRSTHLDGRGDDPKWPMQYAYGIDRPPGAPAEGTR